MDAAETTISTSELLVAFTADFNARYLGEHGTASALGLWLLYALMSPLTVEPERSTIEVLLGTSADDAAGRAHELLAADHPALRSALALWWRAELVLPALEDDAVSAMPDNAWLSSLPAQRAADAWVKKMTDGQITEFPIALEDPLLAIVLSSVLSTTVSWYTPLTLIPGAELAGSFGPQVERALGASGAAFYDTTAGLVAVHVQSADEELSVYSVIADLEASPADLHAAALEVASGSARRRSLFGLNDLREIRQTGTNIIRMDNGLEGRAENR